MKTTADKLATVFAPAAYRRHNPCQGCGIELNGKNWVMETYLCEDCFSGRNKAIIVHGKLDESAK